MKNCLRLKNAFVQLYVLIGMLLLAVSLPLATRLVQQNQENRSSAASTTTYACSNNETKCIGTGLYECNTTRTGWSLKTAGASECSGSTTNSSCSSSNCSNCSSASACSSAGCYWETLTKSCSKLATTNSTSATTCTYTCTSWGSCTADSSSTTGATQTCLAESKSPTNCIGGSGKIGTTKNCTLTTSTCSSSNCSNCSSASACSSAGCYWETLTKSCSKLATTNSTSAPKCGSVKNSCITGTVSGYQTNSTTGVARWSCTSGGTTIDCSYTPNSTTTTCSSGTAGDLRCNGNILQKCFYDADDPTSGWGTYRDCGNAGCSNNACNSNECTSGESSCANGVLKYCSGSGIWITRTCQYGCNSAGNGCKTNNNNVSCTDTGGTCESKCSGSKYHIRYAYSSSSGISAISGCSNDQVCCVSNSTDCTDGDIECRSSSDYKYNYALFECKSGKMTNTKITCMVSGDKIYYGANIPDGWISNRDRNIASIIAGMDLTQYQIELMKRINEAGGIGTRKGVAAAALYLAEKFPYAVSYYSDGGLATDKNQIKSPGFQLVINDNSSFTYTTNWGATVEADDQNRTVAGLNCVGFVEWAYRAAGFDVGLTGSTQNVRDYEGNDNSLMANDASQQQKKLNTVKVGDLVYTATDGNTTHVAIITDIDYASGTVQIAQSSSVGVNVEYIDLFTLEAKDGTGSKNNFNSYTHVGDSYFDQKPALISD